MSISVIDYSENCLVLCGEETKKYKDEIKNIGGSYNPNLKNNGEPFKGWVFSKRNISKVKYAQNILNQIL